MKTIVSRGERCEKSQIFKHMRKHKRPSQQLTVWFWMKKRLNRGFSCPPYLYPHFSTCLITSVFASGQSFFTYLPAETATLQFLCLFFMSIPPPLQPCMNSFSIFQFLSLDLLFFSRVTFSPRLILLLILLPIRNPIFSSSCFVFVFFPS